MDEAPKPIELRAASSQPNIVGADSTHSETDAVFEGDVSKLENVDTSIPDGPEIELGKPPFSWKYFGIGGGIPLLMFIIPLLAVLATEPEYIDSSDFYKNYDIHLELQNGTQYTGEFDIPFDIRVNSCSTEGTATEGGLTGFRSFSCLDLYRNAAYTGAKQGEINGLFDFDGQTGAEDGCGIVWPEDPFHAAIYSFIAEYELGLGAAVGCYLDHYSNPSYEGAAMDLEDNWGGGDALVYAQAWVDDNATNYSQNSFNLTEEFNIAEGGLGLNVANNQQSEQQVVGNWSQSEGYIEVDAGIDLGENIVISFWTFDQSGYSVAYSNSPSSLNARGVDAVKMMCWLAPVSAILLALAGTALGKKQLILGGACALIILPVLGFFSIGIWLNMPFS
jgi:hypothetical protein